jgi:NADPH:quinone reductase-like Zn-dependent oxidoreductase
MKAIICTRYGPPEVLCLRDVEKPVPNDNEVLIRIHATAVTASDCIVRQFSLPLWHPLGLMMGLVIGFSKPRRAILGTVMVGDIETIGKAVTQFKPGDAVYGFSGTRFGCYAEYTCLPAASERTFLPTVGSVLALKPRNMTYAEAAAVPYGCTLASHFLKRARLQRGQKVLIYGASGAIGTTALQLAKHHYGTEVTGVCSSANVELVKSLGADHVLDYTRQGTIPSGERYDVVFDAVGKKKNSPLKQACQQALKPGGTILSVDSGNPTPQPEDLVLLKALIEAGKFTSVIDRTYALKDMVEAHRYVDAGHKKGNVIIEVMPHQ